MTVSKNGVAVLIWGLQFIMLSLGLDAEPGTVEKYAEAIIVVFGLLLAIWNQVSRTDTKWFLLKK
jgi:hypothetical protein